MLIRNIGQHEKKQNSMDYKIRQESVNMDEILSGLKITTCEMHTCGTPIRIVQDGFPEILGKTMLEKIDFVKKKYEHLRKFITYEPRGHHCMSVLEVVPDHPEADVAVMFLEKEGYVSMCGEAVLSLGRYFVDMGAVTPQEPETVIKIQCPCGLVPVHVEYKDKKSGRARFLSVPSFLLAKDVEMNLDGIGPTKVHISYGGCFYAIVSAQSLRISLAGTNDLKAAARIGHEINESVKRKIKLEHPENQSLGSLIGTLIVDFCDWKSDGLVRQLPVFRDSEGRGPCGSGTSAVVAFLHATGMMGLNEEKTFQSAISGGRFAAKVASATRCGPHSAVTVQVTGHGFYTGNSTLLAEIDDPLRKGFVGF